MIRPVLSALAAPLVVAALAACGSDSITSDAAYDACAKGKGTEAEKAFSEDQKRAYCKCLLPKLEAVGLKNSDDFADATSDPKAMAAIRACATKYLARGYNS